MALAQIRAALDAFVDLRASSTSRCGSHDATQHDDVGLRGDGNAAQHAEGLAPLLWTPIVGKRHSAAVIRVVPSPALYQGPSRSKWRLDRAVRCHRWMEPGRWRD